MNTDATIRTRPPMNRPQYIFLPLRLIGGTPQRRKVMFDGGKPFGCHGIGIAVGSMLPSTSVRKDAHCLR